MDSCTGVLIGDHHEPEPTQLHPEDATARFLSRFEPHGVAANQGWGCLGILLLIGAGPVVYGLVDAGVLAWAFPLPVLMILLAVLMTRYDLRTRLDVDGGAVVETKTLGSLFRSRRQPVDLSQVSEVRLTVTRTVSRSMSSVSPTSNTKVHCYAALEVEQRLPVGGHTRRIAGDDLDDVSLYENVTIVAKGWPEDIWFGAG